MIVKPPLERVLDYLTSQLEDIRKEKVEIDAKEGCYFCFLSIIRQQIDLEKKTERGPT